MQAPPITIVEARVAAEGHAGSTQRRLVAVVVMHWIFRCHHRGKTRHHGYPRRERIRHHHGHRLARLGRMRSHQNKNQYSTLTATHYHSLSMIKPVIKKR